MLVKNSIKETVTAFIPNLKVKEKEKADLHLPLALKRLYSYAALNINTVPCIIIQTKGNNTLTQIKKHTRILENKLKQHIVWHLDEAQYYTLQGMMKSNIAFIVPNRQIHLPFLFTSLKKDK